MAASLTPADPEYWDEFYIDGDGHGDVYEWYAAYEVRHIEHQNAIENLFWHLNENS